MGSASRLLSWNRIEHVAVMKLGEATPSLAYYVMQRAFYFRLFGVLLACFLPSCNKPDDASQSRRIAADAYFRAELALEGLAAAMTPEIGSNDSAERSDLSAANAVIEELPKGERFGATADSLLPSVGSKMTLAIIVPPEVAVHPENAPDLALAGLLERAGFLVKFCDGQTTEEWFESDVLLLPSNSSSLGSAQEFKRSELYNLRNYLDAGKIVLEFASGTDEFEWLSFGGEPLRSRESLQATVFQVGDEHPLTQGLASRQRSDSWIDVPPVGLKPNIELPIQSYFGYSSGRRVLLSARRDLEMPLMVESEIGLGRLIQGSYRFDKLRADKNAEAIPLERISLALKFFINLEEYIRDFRSGRALEFKSDEPYYFPSPIVLPVDSEIIPVLPDTQYYCHSFVSDFAEQTYFISKLSETNRIPVTLHLGDVAHFNNTEEWKCAQDALANLDGKVPYVLTTGNHDYGPEGNSSNRKSLFRKAFPYEKYAKQTHPDPGVEYSYAGNPRGAELNSAQWESLLEPGYENSAHFFQVWGTPWMVIALEWNPRPEAIEWARSVLRANDERRAIIVTHLFTNYDDTRYSLQRRHFQRWSPEEYPTDLGRSVHADGEYLWRELIEPEANVRIVLSGHVLGDGAGRLVSFNRGGNRVIQILSNYQMRLGGGEGYLRMMAFEPDGKHVQVVSYSPTLGDYLTNSEHQFRFVVDE